MYINPLYSVMESAVILYQFIPLTFWTCLAINFLLRSHQPSTPSSATTMESAHCKRRSRIC